MIDCREAVRRLWEYLDRALSAEERDAIEEHLGLCRQCCGEVEFAKQLRSFLRDRASADLPADVHRRLNSVLDEIAQFEETP